MEEYIIDSILPSKIQVSRFVKGKKANKEDNIVFLNNNYGED